MPSDDAARPELVLVPVRVVLPADPVLGNEEQDVVARVEAATVGKETSPAAVGLRADGEPTPSTGHTGRSNAVRESGLYVESRIVPSRDTGVEKASLANHNIRR
jgi:hypothetical protein